jgi:DNA-directed RNA polymerase delta subunit
LGFYKKILHYFFILNLISEVESFKGEKNIKQAWINLSFDKNKLHEFIDQAKNLLEEHSKPLKGEEFVLHFKGKDFYLKNSTGLNDKVLLNYLEAATEIRKNPFGEYGLHFWTEIKPKDVGDKAYLVMKHHKKPEHYSVITELINKHNLDERKAYKETVHNELIKDKRFVLVGRGTILTSSVR